MLTNISSLKKPQALWACILSIGLSFSIVAGRLYDTTSFMSFTPKWILALIVLFCVFFVLFYLLLIRTTCKSRTESNKCWQPSKRDIWIVIAIMALIQLIFLLIAWPGIYNHDGVTHIIQLNSSPENYVPLDNKHSVLYTLFVGGSIRIAKTYSIDIYLVFSIVMLIQAIVMMYAQIKASIFVGKRSSSKIFFWITAAFFSLHPFTILIRITSCQDTFFAAFLLLSIIEALKIGEIIEQKKNVKPKNVLPFFVYIVIMCLFRNNGIILYAFAIICMLPFLLKNKLFKTALFFVIPIIAVVIITGPIYKACGVLDIGKTTQEMMSVPSQQLTRSYANSPESFSDKDIEEFNYFYPTITDDVSWYWSGQEISDYPKSLLDADAIGSNKLEFVKFYFRIGMKNLGNYRDAFLMNTLGWWYPFKSYPDSRMYHNYTCYDNIDWDEHPDVTKIERHSVFPDLDQAMSVFVEGAIWNKIPVLNLLFSTGAYTWIFLTLCVIAILNKRVDARFAFLIIFGLFLTFLLSPLCYFRYSFAMITCMPVLMLVGFKNSRKQCVCNSIEATDTDTLSRN